MNIETVRMNHDSRSIVMERTMRVVGVKVISVCVDCLVIALLGGNLPASFAQSDTPQVADSASGGGKWESTQEEGKRDVQIQIERFDDASIAGSIIVVGSPYLHKARLEGRVDSKAVYGVLVGTDDQQIGTFAGTVADTGLSGTYTTNQGDSGSWNWAAPAAAEALKENTGIGEAAAPVN